MGLDLQEQELVRQALDQWSVQDSAQVEQELAQGQQVQVQDRQESVADRQELVADQQRDLAQWVALDLARVQRARVQVLEAQVLAQLAQVEQVQVQVVQLAQALVEKSQGRELAQAALVLAQEQRRLVRLQLAQV